VDEFVVIERHAVYFVIGSKRESLGTDFHTNWVSIRFGVDVSFVVEYPPVCFITIKRDTAIDTTLDIVAT
ncbi:MAG: hypothetical protein RL098_1484, partial [Bacteroidota bacterium]